MVSFSNRLCQGAFYAIAQNNHSLDYGGLAYASFSSPLRNSHSVSIHFKKSIVSSIVLLLRLCRPSAIFFAVISIGINPIKGVVFARPFTHISKKYIEVFAPLFRYFNSTSTIQSVFRICFTKTPGFCANPRAPLWRICHAMFFAIFLNILFCNFFLETPTASGFVVPKPRYGGISIFSTITNTLNSCLRVPALWNFHNYKSCISITYFNHKNRNVGLLDENVNYKEKQIG